MVAAAALLIGLWFAMLTVGAGPVDEAGLDLYYAGGHPLLIAIARGFTLLGKAWVMIPIAVVAGALLIRQGRTRAGIAGVLVILVGRVLVEAQKYSIERLRPSDEAHLVPVSTPSFPSGHAGNSMIVCLTLAILFFGHTRWRTAALVVALLISFCIGLSRLMLGVHWPTDVIGGWAFGLLWVVVSLPWMQRRLAGPIEPSAAKE